MAEYLLADTCIVIDDLNNRSGLLSELLANGTTLFINSVIEMELLQGARNKTELAVIKKRLQSFRLLNLQQAIFDLATDSVRTLLLITSFSLTGCGDWRDSYFLSNSVTDL